MTDKSETNPDQQILSSLTHYPLCTSTQISLLTGILPHSVYPALLRLELDGRIVGARQGWPARRRYRIAGAV